MADRNRYLSWPEGLALLAVMFCGALFGFFVAWDVSTIHGLDRTPPEVAIAAMQAMNDSVHNFAFALVYFGTPLVLAVAALMLWQAGAHRRGAAWAMTLALLALLAGVIWLTSAVNVPMNRALAEAGLPGDPQARVALWASYSPRWQLANHLRSFASGLALLLAALALRAAARGGGGNWSEG